MAQIQKKEICKCTNCGNEGEMVVTCSLEDSDITSTDKPQAKSKKVKGTATCSHCGNEADMWIDI